MLDRLISDTPLCVCAGITVRLDRRTDCGSIRDGLRQDRLSDTHGIPTDQRKKIYINKLFLDQRLMKESPPAYEIHPPIVFDKVIVCGDFNLKSFANARKRIGI